MFQHRKIIELSFVTIKKYGLFITLPRFLGALHPSSVLLITYRSSTPTVFPDCIETIITRLSADSVPLCSVDLLLKYLIGSFFNVFPDWAHISVLLLPPFRESLRRITQSEYLEYETLFWFHNAKNKCSIIVPYLASNCTRHSWGALSNDILPQYTLCLGSGCRNILEDGKWNL